MPLLKIVVYQHHLSHADPYLSAFVRGLQRHGLAPEERKSTDPIPCDVAVCWGWRQAQKHIALGARPLVVERGYVGDRFRWASVGWDGLNGRARFPRADSGDRWQKYHGGRLMPWIENDGGYVLLLGQVPGDSAITHLNIDQFYARVARHFWQQMRPVKFRPHPNAPKVRVKYTDVLGGNLYDALQGAALAVTCNSNSGVDAALWGVPVYALDEGAMCWPVASHELTDEPKRPDRTKWAWDLAYAQWLPHEIESGEAWDRLKDV